MSPSRKLWLQASSSFSAPAPDPAAAAKRTLDETAIIILAILLSALISSVLLATIVRCAIRCSRGRELETEDNATDKHTARMRRKALRSLPLISYSAGLELPGDECAICLSEFLVGDGIRVLPECKHRFHVYCVDRWLLARPSCPTCRRCLFSSCHKVSRCGETSRRGIGQSAIVPLEPEGLLLGILL